MLSRFSALNATLVLGFALLFTACDTDAFTGIDPGTPGDTATPTLNIRLTDAPAIRATTTSAPGCARLGI